MDALIFKMEKLLASDRKGSDVQYIIVISGETAGKNIDDLLIEADKIIGETLPYFQSSLNTKEIKKSNDFGCIKINHETIPAQPKHFRTDTKRVVFNLKNNCQNIKISENRSKTSIIHGKLATNKYTKNKEIKKKQICSSTIMVPEFKAPEVNFIQNQLHVSSALLENHDRLQFLCNRHDKLVNSLKTQDQMNKLRIEEELNYYKLRNYELEKNLKCKEQEIRDWEIQYQQLHHYYCDKFSKNNIEETLKRYECQLNELVERNLSRESKLHTVISSLLEEIDQSHLQYRIKLSKKNKQIRTYIDQIESILNSVYEFRNNNSKLLH